MTTALDVTRAQAIITKAELGEEILTNHLEKNEDQYYWLVSRHNQKATDNADTKCHKVTGDHYHFILWWRNSRYYTDLPLNSFIRRCQEKYRNGNEEVYTHQKVRNVKSLMLYMQTEPRMYLPKERKNLSPELEAVVDNLDDRTLVRMAEYVEKKDAKMARQIPERQGSLVAHQQLVKVDLQTVIDFIREDGCFSFDDWQIQNTGSSPY